MQKGEGEGEGEGAQKTGMLAAGYQNNITWGETERALTYLGPYSGCLVFHIIMYHISSILVEC